MSAGSVTSALRSCHLLPGYVTREGVGPWQSEFGAGCCKAVSWVWSHVTAATPRNLSTVLFTQLKDLGSIL